LLPITGDAILPVAAQELSVLIHQSTWSASNWESGTACRAIGARYQPITQLILGNLAGMRKNPEVGIDRPTIAW
jgi:hypothetical protein